MKAKREHRVPLCDRALEILEEAKDLRGSNDLVFPSPSTGKPLSDSTISKLLRDLGIKAVPHGFRSSFKTWVVEKTNTPREVSELALAHVNNDRVEAAYQRSDLFEKRRGLMELWAKHLNQVTAKVYAIA